MGLDFRSNALAVRPELVEHLFASALLRVIRIQHFEPHGGARDVLRSPMLRHDTFAIALATESRRLDFNRFSASL
jgi:hypothetical protein